MITVCQIKVFASRKRKQKRPKEEQSRIGVGEKRNRTFVKQSPSSETKQVRQFRETIVLFREEYSRKSPDQVNWSLLRRARC